MDRQIATPWWRQRRTLIAAGVTVAVLVAAAFGALALCCTTAGVKDTAWGLMYDPNAQARPALEMGFLTGFDTVQIYQEVPNTMRVGGGVDPALGNFYTMNQNFKGLLVMGGTQIDGRSNVWSTGQGV